MQTDEALMAQFQAGTLTAFNELVKKYDKFLFKFAVKRLKDEEAAKDIVQETFIRIYRNRFSYNGVSKFSTWMYTIAVNLINSEYRLQKRRYSFSIDDPDFIEKAADLIGVEVIVNGKMQRHYIHMAINSLKDSAREIIILRDIQQLQYHEIAEITGAPLGSVKSEIHRARKRLKKLLKDIR